MATYGNEGAWARPGDGWRGIHASGPVGKGGVGAVAELLVAEHEDRRTLFQRVMGCRAVVPANLGREAELVRVAGNAGDALAAEVELCDDTSRRRHGEAAQPGKSKPALRMKATWVGVS